MPTASFSWHGGVTAWRFGDDTDGADEIVVLGRGQGRADWVAATDAGAASIRRVHFVDLDSLDAGNLEVLLNQIDNNGVTALGVYTADDSTPLPGSAAANVSEHLSTAVGAHPRISLSALDSAGSNLQALIATVG